MIVSDMITMSRLGTAGQWGNQVIQYAYMRVCARRYGCDYGVPSWAGQYLFGHDDPPVKCVLPEVHERYGPCQYEQCFGVPSPPSKEEQLGHNFMGWAQYHTSWYAPDKKFILSLYDAVPPELDRVQPALKVLRTLGKTLVVFHLRRSDAGRMIFHLTPVTWYLRWLREHWKRLEDPVLYIATEEPELAHAFRHYDPVMMEDLGIKARAQPPKYQYPYGDKFHDLRQLDFFPDWYVMQNADVVVGSDSTFSFTAVWTSRINQEYWRSRLSRQCFERIDDPWNADASWREHLNDYPGIPGTQIDSNPTYDEYWRSHTTQFPAIPLDPEEVKSLEKPE